MRNSDKWRPSKYQIVKGSLRASRDTEYVSVSSRLCIELIAKFYSSHIPKYLKGTLVDLGCGKVPLYEFYKDHVRETICIDWGNSFHSNRHLDIEQDLNKPILLEDNFCDSIILSDVLEHIREPKSLFSEMYRILKPDGKVLMNVPFLYWIHEQPYDYYRYTEFALEYMAKESGFKVEKLEAYGGVVETLIDTVSKQIIGIKVIGKFISHIIQKMGFLWTKTKFGNKVLTKSSVTFPMGYCIILAKVNE